MPGARVLKEPLRRKQLPPAPRQRRSHPGIAVQVDRDACRVTEWSAVVGDNGYSGADAVAVDHAPYEDILKPNLPYSRDAVIDITKELITKYRPAGIVGSETRR